MDGIMGIISLIILGSGIYVLYAWYNMKVTGEISETLLIGKGQETKRCKDKEAFIKKTSPAVLLLGIVVTICGAIISLRHYVLQDNELIIFLDPITSIVVVVAIIIYGIYTRKQKKIYFDS